MHRHTCRPAAGSRLTRSGFPGVLAVLLSCGAAFGQPNEDEGVLQRVRKQVLSRAVPYAPPDRISKRAPDPAKKEVTAELNVQFAEVDVEHPDAKGMITKDRVRVRTYNGKMTAPEMRVSPGDLLRVRLYNRILRTEPDKLFALNKPNGFNITNLHTHGLHVSPEGRGDNVYLEVGPEEGIGLCFDIPEKHTPGTFWFHAHRHGSTALQLSSGMAGALIVDPGPAGGLDSVPEIKDAMRDGREKILVFQQLKYTINPKTNVGEVTEQDVYDDKPQHRVTLINGNYAPLITMRPGEVQRWRCVHGGIDSELNLAVINAAGQGRWDLHEIAADGLPLYRINTPKEKTILLYPGYRSDFLVQAPPQKGEYLLINAPVPAARAFRKVAVGQAFRRVPLPAVTLARVCVTGNPVTMRLPQPDAIGKYALPPIDPDELFNRIPYKLEFSVDKTTATINGREFDPAREGVCPRLGTAEEWSLTATNDKHPFHIHVNPFMVVKKDDKGNVTSRLWKDTILVDGDGTDPPTLVWMRFEDFAGKTVLHCHNLQHEDRGMMMAVRIVGGPTPSPRCDPKQPAGLPGPRAAAPAWSLPDPVGRIHRLADLRGEAHLLVFYRGLACSHCRRQLEALAQHRTALAAAKLKVVAVSPDTGGTLKRVLRDGEAARPLPFLFLSDSSLGTFRRYGCFDGRALHGTFLVGADGTVLWQDVGDEPYMDIEGLLALCRRALPVPRP